MSNKKYSKRIVKNQSMNMNNATSKTWRNDDGSYTTAIPVPSFVFNQTHMFLLLNMASYVADYMERENIKSVEQWDKRADDENFKNKTFIRIMNDFGNTCYGNLNIDMIEHAPILLHCVEELMNFKREWCDGFVTKQTNFKYEWLPILHAVACNIIRNIEQFAPKFIEFRRECHKRMNEQKAA